MKSKRKLILVLLVCLTVVISACTSCAPSAPPPETVTSPNTASGASAGDVGQSLAYTTGGASSSEGYSLKYVFNWGDGNSTETEFVSSGINISKPHTWSSTGTYSIRAKAISSTGISSTWSGSKKVTIAEPATEPEPFLVASAPTGPSTGKVKQSMTYSTSASSNMAGSPEYRFDWDDGNYSSWSYSTSASYSWSRSSTYMVRAQARHSGIVSEWSPDKVVVIEQEALSRQPFGQPEQMKQYVTPNEPEVKAAVQDILSGEWRWAYNDFNALREWTCIHVDPISDKEAHGIGEYWQLPAETLELGTGDCEDYAILLCTLLRAYGVPADEVYVIAGYSSEGEHGHAYLYEHWYKGVWRAIEPQWDPLSDALTFETWGPADLATYTKDLWCFNDEYCIQGVPSPPSGIYEFEVGYSSWPVSRGASVVFQRHLTAGELVSGLLEWLKAAGENPRVIYDWSLIVYDPSGDCMLTLSGTDMERSFSFVAKVSGLYKLEVLKRDYLARCARLTIDPPDWSKQ